MKKSIDAQLDEIYDKIDDLLKEGKFDIVDNILKSVSNDIKQTSIDILLGYLTITFVAKSKLKNRQILLDKTKEEFNQREELKDENVTELLKGL